MISCNVNKIMCSTIPCILALYFSQTEVNNRNHNRNHTNNITKESRNSYSSLIYPQKTNYSKPNPSYFVPSVILSNVMSLAPKIDEIRLYAQHQSPDIMCFTETWLRNVVNDSAIHIRDYTIARRDRTHAQHGGVYIVISTLVKIGKTRNCVKTLRPSGVVFPHNFSFFQFPLVLI